MAEHNEFPPLGPKAQKVLASFDRIDISKPGWNQRFAAAVIREAIMQSGTWNINRDFPRVIDARDLGAIADNLHALPPPPPTREQMEEALSSLLGQIVCHPKSQFAQEAAILAAGIAHYCSPTP